MSVKNCESCMMPLAKDTGKRTSDKYCSYCYQNGKLFGDDNDLKGFQKTAYKSMRERGMNSLVAWFFAFSIRFAPRWKK